MSWLVSLQPIVLLKTRQVVALLHQGSVQEGKTVLAVRLVRQAERQSLGGVEDCGLGLVRKIDFNLPDLRRALGDQAFVEANGGLHI